MREVIKRCGWVSDNPLYIQYHDQEWGKPVFDDQTLFEMLVLESAQAGLSWLTILKKRDAYRQAFCQFDIQKVAHFNQQDQQRLLANPGIVRNRLKVASAINNANRVLAVQQEHGSFASFIWSFVDGQPIQNGWQQSSDVPVSTPLSDQLSSTLKQLGFSFVGTKICYAYLQAIGMVNDHLVNCSSYEACQQLGEIHAV